MSKQEELLAFQLMAAKLPEPTREHTFCNGRRWRFDFAWPGSMLAVEVEGVVFSNANTRRKPHEKPRALGRHQRAAGYSKDCDKYNEAALLGWRVLRFTQVHIKNGTALQTIERALYGKG